MVDGRTHKERFMPIRHIAASVTALALALSASASELHPQSTTHSNSCVGASQGSFRPEADLRAVLERLGYQVNRIKTEDACYEVHATDRSGKRYEVKFKGDDLKMVSRYEVRSER
jgi:hypothetical protein